MPLRSRYHHFRGPAWKVNLNTDSRPMAAAPVQVSALDLPGEQKFALIYLLKTRAEAAANIVCNRLDEQGIPFPRERPDWYDLRRFGYAERTQDGARHRPTPKGLAAAKIILGDLCIKFNVHVFELTGGPGTRRGFISRCSCLRWSHGPEMTTRGGESRIRSAQAAHLRDVADGRCSSRTLNDFLNHVAPPQLNFSGSALGQPTAPPVVPENGAETRTDVLRGSAPVDLQRGDQPR